MTNRYHTVSWDQLHRDSKALAWRLMERGPFHGIVAITRGGLIPAAIVARELERPAARSWPGYFPAFRAMGATNCASVSQGKRIQVSWLTSVMKVSTSGRPFGLA